MKPFNNDDAVPEHVLKNLLYKPKQIRLILNEERSKIIGLALLLRQAGSMGIADPPGDVYVKDVAVWDVENMLTGEEERYSVEHLGKQINAMEAVAWAAKLQ